MPLNRNMPFRLLLALLISFIPFSSLFSQNKLNHEIMLERVRHGNDNIYKECIKEYDAYLNKNPDDVAIFIEKCMFIQFAQYNEYEDYNPHQAEFDSCATVLINRFPDHPEVLIFQTSYKWGEELEEVFKNAEKAIAQNAKDWNKTSLSKMYKQMADHYYFNDESTSLALTYIKKAIFYNKDYKYTLEHAGILAEADKKEEALKILRSIPDTTKVAWQLTRKANLLLELEAYPDALAVYKLVDEIDPDYISNSNLATTLEGVGEYEKAREYFVADAAESWNKENALRNLLRHDLKYQDGDKCISSYNKFRDLGYSADPVALYRLKLFFLHPTQPWLFRDILGLLSFLLVIAILIVIPYLWILPIYFIGNYWNFVNRQKPYPSFWGLKAFWFISAGYLIASFLSAIAEPEMLYYILGSSDYTVNIAPSDIAASVIIATAGMALFGFAAMYKVNPMILLSQWPATKSILIGIGALIIYKLASAVYFMLSGASSITGFFFASTENIEPIINTFGKGLSILIVGLIVPVYEEIIFRGVILDSTQRYLSFNAANIIQSLIFAFAHMSLVLMPVYFLFGIFTGYLRKKSGGLLPGIVFHALNNIIVILIFFALNR